LSPPCPPCSTKARKPFLLRKACKSSAFFLVEKLPSWITHASAPAASGALVAGAVGAAAGAVFTGGAGAAPFATGVEGETGAGDAGGCAGRSSIRRAGGEIGFRLPAPLLERQDPRHEALRRRRGHAAAMSPPLALVTEIQHDRHDDHRERDQHRGPDDTLLDLRALHRYPAFTRCARGAHQTARCAGCKAAATV